jgi:bidirectional [NiFe] hydrogenase diaphorase subunit
LFDWQPRFPLCLIFGHEVDGVGEELSAMCDTHIRIPMLGRKHSLNVATAGGVVLFELLRKYRRMTVELLFAERNHVCAGCVANNHCELQDVGIAVGMDHVRYDYLYPKLEVDLTHAQFGMDQNRCILCARCVRVCDEIEGAHTWDVFGRGVKAHVITDLNQPWGASLSCTSCGKCVMACPTGAIFKLGSTVEESVKDRSKLAFLKNARDKKQWVM